MGTIAMSLAKTTRCAFAFILTILTVSPAWSQNPPAASDAARAQAIHAIITSPQWQQMLQKFDKWLAVQQIYTMEEIDAIKNDFNVRISQMQPQEVNQFLVDMNARLDVLLSAQTEEAREWVSQFLTVAKNPRERLESKRPDVMNMSASQIRQELQQFQQQQSIRQQSQAAFDLTRELQVQSAQNIQASRNQAFDQAQANRAQAPANTVARSPYAPRPQNMPNYTDFNRVVPRSYSPIYSVGPWGNPIRWNPLRDDYWWGW